MFYQVAASDIDAGANGTISFSITEDSPTNSTKLFSVDRNTGAIKARLSSAGSESPLLGHMGTYSFSVLATDHGTPPMNNSANVEITITDVNDHAPMFVTPSGTKEDIRVLEVGGP